VFLRRWHWLFVNEYSGCRKAHLRVMRPNAHLFSFDLSSGVDFALAARMKKGQT
jgi:hypothetical protein